MSDRDLQTLRRAWRRAATRTSAAAYSAALERRVGVVSDDTEIADTSTLGDRQAGHRRAEWYDRAREVTVETLPEYFAWLLDSGDVDYEDLAHMIGAAALAGAQAVDGSKHGGVSAAQGSRAMWCFVHAWLRSSNFLRMIDFGSMLFPQNHYLFDPTMPPEVWHWLQDQAAAHLADDFGIPPAERVAAHWRSIVDGRVPFGYTVTGP